MENAVILKQLKRRFNAGKVPRLFFWRDHRGREIDLIEETAEGMRATEIKPGSTLQNGHFDNLHWLAEIAKEGLASVSLVYGGTRNTRRRDVEVFAWHSL